MIDKTAAQEARETVKTLKETLKAARAAVKAARTETKAVREAARAARAEKREGKEAAKAEKVAAREAKKAAKVQAKADKALLRELTKRVEQNGVAAPNRGSQCAAVWAVMSEGNEVGKILTGAEALRALPDHNPSTVLTQRSLWLKFHGLTIRKAKAPTPETAPTPPTETSFTPHPFAEE